MEGVYPITVDFARVVEASAESFEDVSVRKDIGHQISIVSVPEMFPFKSSY